MLVIENGGYSYCQILYDLKINIPLLLLLVFRNIHFYKYETHCYIAKRLKLSMFVKLRCIIFLYDMSNVFVNFSLSYEEKRIV